MFYKTFTTVCLVMALAFSACTVESDDDNPSSPESYQLSSITTIGNVAFVRYDYDSKGRIVRIATDDEKMEFTYEDNSQLPATVTATDYSHTLNNVRYEEDVLMLTDMKYNDYGWLVSASTKDVFTYEVYKESGEMTFQKDVTFWTETLKYDEQGHLLKSTAHTPGESDDVTTYVWEGDLLMKTYDNVEPVETTVFEYSSIDNTLGVTDPFTAVGGPMGITGIFGKNPSKFVKKMTYTSESSYEVSQFSYSFLSNGLIDKMKVNEDGDETTLKFNYNIIKR